MQKGRVAEKKTTDEDKELVINKSWPLLQLIRVN